MKITDDPLFPAFICAYRSNILVKYGTKNLSRYPDFSSIPREKVDTMIRYFLELLYPEWEDRLRLDSAFSSLKGFVSKPSKVFGLMGSLGLSLWKIGKFLPEAFRAGIVALSSYITAHSMEARLLEEGIKFVEEGMDMEEEKVFQKMLSVIPREEAEKFRKNTVSLFRTLTHEELVDRIILIMENILDKMKEKTNLYNKEEVEGIGLGLSILQKGKEILQTLTDEEKKMFLTAIDKIEKDYYESCFL